MHKTNYNVQYNIPRVYVQAPGRQNRLLDGDFRVSAGLSEAVEFFFGNQDGVPLNLLPFRIKFVVWDYSGLAEETLSMGQSDIVLAKTLQVDDPYAGRVEMLLTDSETLKLGLRAGRALRWSLFMINEDGDVFPMQVARGGSRYAPLYVDLESGLPPAELIRNA